MNEQGQVTERCTRAIDQPGSSEPSDTAIRLGGVYALERLAIDSPRDRDTVVDVLAAIRASSPRTTRACPATPPDVSAAFTVLTRRPPTTRRFDLIDLRRTAWSGSTATNDPDLRHVSLVGADVDFDRVDLDGADLTRASLLGADLTTASHEGTVTDDVRVDSSTEGAWWPTC